MTSGGKEEANAGFNPAEWTYGKPASDAGKWTYGEAGCHPAEKKKQMPDSIRRKRRKGK